MNNRWQNIFAALPFIALLLCTVGLAIPGPAFASSGEGHADEHDEHKETRGPHGGRLLEDGDLKVELLIFERGVPPEFRAWISDGGELLTEAGDARLTVELTRLGGDVDRFRFAPAGGFWRAEGSVEEPHSFDVKVSLARNAERAEWSYASHEARVKISAEMAAKVGIETAVAGPGEIRKSLTLYGETALAHGSLSHVRARYPGPIKSVAVEIGDRVRKGQTLAKVESNDSLQVYPITAPIDGLVIDKRASAGEYSGERELFTIANYDQLWAELRVFPAQRAQVARGQKVILSADGQEVEAEIATLVPGVMAQSFVVARAPVDNRQLNWPPDLMLEGKVEVDRVRVPLLVEQRALQPLRDWTVVFVKVGDVYEARPLELGRSDGRVTEVLDGLKPGERYVTANSYLIKADIEKSGAAHAH
ncbi:efflux RND transporter periplasmic adaptor subunit [Microbulbifer rhizosphaerae]|uniref:Cobalt-zinc-cadmium efflux system membrane fusion protein n=1 Tax=Microbulbifer rhizosphaerae TaxID=1562603 RepID=A0A7W4WC09_9GAMM|nr:efflux RND transporter periplasmic adaptor subunit [Microbulbifer rhizosphaerae]MBB3061314.1 cobalt-zinc-cadmium efflux system membrane fusion protein [Microbulbifer rhizosphaerae]